MNYNLSNQSCTFVSISTSSKVSLKISESYQNIAHDVSPQVFQDQYKEGETNSKGLKYSYGNGDVNVAYDLPHDFQCCHIHVGIVNLFYVTLTNLTSNNLDHDLVQETFS